MGWRGPWTGHGRRIPTDMENGWSRFHSSCVTGPVDRRLKLITAFCCWLSQANHIFSQIPTGRRYEDYFLVSRIDYVLKFSIPPENLPEGYLFLCPLEDLRTENGTWITFSEHPAYWSLDSLGNQRLTQQEAANLGFPSLQLEVAVHGRSWHESVYAVLNRFHVGKGFNPNSPDIARHLEQPIYELSRRPHVDIAQVEELSSARKDTMAHDAPHPQKFRIMIVGVLGLSLAVMLSWLYQH
ncbi:hypothetical protein C8R44DRAFT_813575 [Mycena epipterygia]|nr:hypothetical protein C8R44DRAFT_813575 [Mycena epipterygia]